MSKAWKTLAQRYLLRRPWMNVREDRVEQPDGRVLDEYHVLEYPDWALAICFDTSGALVMVEQYRYPIGQMSLEFPSGAVDAGEAPLAAARRELLEETGYAADDWTLVGSCAPDPSRQANRAHLFVARGARRVAEQRLDPSEDITVRHVAPEALFGDATAGRIQHSMHLTALFWARHRGLL